MKTLDLTFTKSPIDIPIRKKKSINHYYSKRVNQKDFMKKNKHLDHHPLSIANKETSGMI